MATRRRWRFTKKDRNTVHTKEGSVLLVGSELAKLPDLQHELQARHFEVEAASKGEDGLALALLRTLIAAVSEVEMPEFSGLDFLAKLRRERPALPIILIARRATPQDAIKAFQLGVHSYIQKPIEPSKLADVIEKAALSKSSPPASINVSNHSSETPELTGFSPAMQNLYKQIALATRSSRNALIRGQTGTGKQLVARAIHKYSQQANQPFVEVNCAAIPETLFESELFGHEIGAFTGAQNKRIGSFEQAGKGTLFLDEIGDLSSPLQVKLLRVLQEKQVQRLGANRVVDINARVVAATNRDLESAMEREQFREDLFYRLTPLTIWVPPLNRRLADIPDLVAQFIRQTCGAASGIGADALRFLQNQPWPGNVRQLKNVVNQAASLSVSKVINLADVTTAYRSAEQPAERVNRGLSGYIEDLLTRVQRGLIHNAHQHIVDEIEKHLFSHAIHLANGNQTKIARWLSLNRRTVREKLEKFDLHPAYHSFYGVQSSPSDSEHSCSHGADMRDLIQYGAQPF
jgi:DNA-binding NtrC family response regulator